jgi:group I intron endonuclease
MILNVSNGKRYVGLTTNFPTRIRSHLQVASTLKIDSELYRDMNTNLTNFSFQILQEQVPLKKLREVETNWIEKLGTLSEYNIVRKSGNERLNENEIDEICSLIETTNLKFEEIALIFEVSSALIADINLGRAWGNSKFIYPLRKTTVKRKKLTEKDILDIYEKLRNPLLSFDDIKKCYGWDSQAVLRKINNGTYSIKLLPSEAYPIRPVDSRKGKRYH